MDIIKYLYIIWIICVILVNADELNESDIESNRFVSPAAVLELDFLNTKDGSELESSRLEEDHTSSNLDFELETTTILPTEANLNDESFSEPENFEGYSSTIENVSPDDGFDGQEGSMAENRKEFETTTMMDESENGDGSGDFNLNVYQEASESGSGNGIEPTLFFLSKVGSINLSHIENEDYTNVTETGSPVSLPLVNQSQSFEILEMDSHVNENPEVSSSPENNFTTLEHRFVSLSPNEFSNNHSKESFSSESQYSILNEPEPELDTAYPVSQNLSDFSQGRFQFPTTEDNSNWIQEEVIVNSWGMPDQCSPFVIKEKEKHLAVIQDLLLAKYELEALKLNITQTSSAISIPSNTGNLAQNLRLLLNQNMSVTLFMNITERAVLVVSEDLVLEMTSEDAFITFGLSKDTSTAENIEPSFINHDWLQINAPKKMRKFFPRSVHNSTLITLICDEPQGCKINLTTKISISKGYSELTSFLNNSESDDECLDCSPLVPQLENLETKEIEFAQVCDVRCLLNGECDNGTCICQVGWNGQYCSIPGCPDECNGNGNCQQVEGLWKCKCDPGWESESCTHPKELECSDRSDNDEDGLIDCEDPDCCQLSPECRGKQLCMSVPDPNSLVSPTTQHSTFWNRIKFLVHETNGIQRYAKTSGFDSKTVCVIRGRIVTEYGSPIVGTRISRENRLQEGFTLSREDGNFDFVDSCESRKVELLFGKSPFVFIEKTFVVVPNTINHVGDIMLSVPGHPANQAQHSCKSNFPTQEFSIEVTTNFNQEKKIDQIRLIGTHLKLHYNPDSRSSSFTARVVVGEKCCQPWVYKTTISFSIEGLTFGQVYEPESELRTNFKWNKTDLYGQRVYGKSVGVLEVCFHGREAGCHRKDCQSINVELNGHNPHKRDFGGWSLGLHHNLDVQNAILYFGDGEISDLKIEGPSQRPSNTFYENQTDQFRPIGLILDDDENVIFVLTLTDVRGISKLNGTETVLLRLDSKSYGVRNYITYNGKHRLLIVSLPNEKIVVATQVNVSSDGTFVTSSWFKLVGNGQPCVGNRACGDDGEAGKAKLAYPKGMASIGDLLYIADGHRIRVVDLARVRIRTLAGQVEEDWGATGGKFPPKQCTSWKELSDVQELSWPTVLAINPIDESLFLLDNNQIRSLTKDGQIYNHCFQRDSKKTEEYKFIKFSRSGECFIGAIHEENGNLLIERRSDGTFINIPFEQNMTTLGDFAILNTNEILFSEPDKFKLSIMSKGRFEINENGNFVVPWPLKDEIYVFSSDGYHLETRSIFTDASVLQFTYDHDKKLASVKDQAVVIIEYTEPGKLLFNFSNNKFAVHLIISNSSHLLESVKFMSGREIRLEYEDLFLLKSILEDETFTSQINDPEMDLTTSSKCEKSLYNISFICYGKAAIARFEFQERSLPRRIGSDSKTLQIPSLVQFSLESNKTVNISWEYYLRQQSRNFDGFSGAGKHFQINGETQFSVEIHPRSLVQSLYDKKSQQILRVEEFYIPPNRLWIPAQPFEMLDEQFDLSGKILSWKWGNLTEIYTYDIKDRMVRVNVGNVQEINFAYEDEIFPKQIVTASGGTFMLLRNPVGELKSIMTPGGQVHSWKIVPCIYHIVVEYQAPWAENSFRFSYHLDKMDKPFQVYYPSGATIITASGSASTEISCGGNLCKTTSTLNNTKKTQIGSSDGEKLNISQTKFQNSESLIVSFSSLKFGERVSLIEWNHTFGIVKVSVNNSTFMMTKIYLNSLTDRIEAVGNFVYSYDGFSNMIKNEVDDFLYVADVDANGRESSRAMLADGEAIYHKKLTYSSEGLLTSQTVRTKKSVLNMNYSYNNLGQIDLHDEGKFFQWHHQYDKSGNLINADFGTGNTSKEFEFGERVSSIGGLKVSYDKDGREVERHSLSFQYNDFSQLEEILDSGNSVTRFIYDDQQRLILKFDLKTSEVLTFFYTIQNKPTLVTHIHSHKSNETRHLVYDDKDRLLAITSDGRETLYVATDLSGTVKLLLNKLGDIVQVPLRTPFGEHIEHPLKDDLNWIPIGFRGGIEDPSSGVIIFNGKAPYDSVLGQWMVPQIHDVMHPDFDDVETLFSYRFFNNNPLRPDISTSYMNNLDDWLKLYQISLPRDVLKKAKIPKMLDIFQRTELEGRVRFKNQERRPKLFEGFNTESKIFGGNFTFATEQLGTNPDDPSFFQRRISILTYDQSDLKSHALATILQGSIIMSPQASPTTVDVFIDNTNLSGNKSELDDLIARFSGRIVWTNDERMIVNCTTNNSAELKFWIGFTDVLEAESKREELRR